MHILALDTTSEHGGAGIFRGAECLALVPSTGPANRYSITLFQMLEALVAEVRGRRGFERFGLGDIELFAAANGPGSFAGIRVGLAAAQAWSRAFGRPARGVSVLEAMVEEARPASGLAASLLDARRGEFYLGVFRRASRPGSSSFFLEGEAQVLGPDAVRAALEAPQRGGAELACVVRAEDERARALVANPPGRLRVHETRATLVPAIARLALAAERAGASPSTSTLDAYYIRRSDAELNWKD